ncbi:MAG: hypothetical protein ACRCWI_00050 [Brevinema sp.]
MLKNSMIPILKIGCYTDSKGKVLELTHQILQEIADCYSENSAPLIKGHPNSEDPAMGWVHQLKLIGDKLYASFTDINEIFKQELKKKLFKNISASFFLPNSSSNPQQGKYCLRHVGALGATRPAIPNLGRLQDILSFSEEEDNIIFFSEHPPLLEQMIQQFKQIRNSNDLSTKLQQAQQEIRNLKDQLLQKQLEETIHQALDKIMLKKRLSEEKILQLKESVLKISTKPLSPQELITEFAEFIPHKQEEIRSHRFQEYPISAQEEIFEFSENIENTALFADEVEKLCLTGISRNDAYKQAKINVYKGHLFN